MRLRLRALAIALTAGLLASIALAPSPASATPVLSSYATTIAGNPTDVYHPAVAAGTKLPFALLLQGADVDKAQYSQYASQVAAQGFIVVVSNNESLLLGGLYADQAQVSDTATWAVFENLRLTSPLRGKIKTDTMVLLGHSFGGVAGLFSATGVCLPPFCRGVYVRPLALKAAAFYGTNTAISGLTLPALLNGVDTALIQGSLDGNATPTETQTTFDLSVGAKRALVSIDGANHYGLTNENNPAGAVPDANAPTLSQADSIAKAALWSGQWLKAQLGDPVAQAFIAGGGEAADPTVSVQRAG